MNCNELLNIKYKLHSAFFIMILLGIILTVYLFNCEIYEVYNIYGYIKNHNLVLNIPIEYSDTITNGEYLIINEKKYNYNVSDISEILLNNNINYQEITLKLDNNFLENQVLKINIYYAKEKVLKKVKKTVFGG